MAARRTFGLAFAVVLCAGDAPAAEVARIAVGRGHLASRVGDAEWRGLRLGDELPASSRLRTSPMGPVRVELPAGVLSLAGETEVELDIAAKRIVIEWGRVLIRHSGDEGSWTVTTGTTTFDCPPGSEAEISYAETIGANVLKGGVQVTRPNLVDGTPIQLQAPVEWIGDKQGIAKSSVPTADDWSSRIQRRMEPREEQGLGQLVANDAQTNSPVRLEVARYHVNVVLQPPVALVQIDQSFFNPYSRQEEGTFVFNLPDQASVSRFAMFVTHDQLIEGELIDRKRADEVYTKIVRSKRDPAILEQIGDNLFRMRVFPIFAHDTKRILLDYTIPLVADRGRYRFELPLMSDLKPIWDFGITGLIQPPFATGSISSQTHPNLEFVTGDDGHVTFSQRERNVQPPPNLLVEFRVPEQSQPTVRTFTTDDGNQHFVVTLPESANPAPIETPRPMDLLVLVDTSGSAGDLSRARLTARTLVGNLRPQDRWQIGCIDIGYRPITSEWQATRPQPAQAALQKLDEAFALGGSQLDAATEASLQAFTTSPENRRRVIFYLGDGEATMICDRSCWQHASFRANNPTRTEFHAVKLGDENAAGNWLKQGTQQTGGRIFAFHGSTSILRDLFEWTLAGMPLETPIVSSGIETVPAEDLFHDSTWPRGRELHVYGRCQPVKSLELKLKLAELPVRSYHLNVVEHQGDADVFTGRLWARNKLQSLLTGNRNPTNAARASIVQLCQEWSLMSPFTAFLVLETEKDYDVWNIPRQLRHRYWKPAGVVEAVPLPEHLRQLANQDAVPKPQAAQTTMLVAKQDEQVRAHLDAAKEALSKGNASVAMSHLSAVRIDANKVDSVAFDSLLAEARKGLRRDITLSELKLWQLLVDRRAGDPLPAIAPLMMNFAYGGVNPEYLERHPHAMKLLKPAPEFLTNKVPLPELAKAIQDAIGIPIMINRSELRDEGIPSDLVVDLDGLRGTPVRTLLNLTLEKYLLTIIPERHFLRITTETAAVEMIRSHVYPIIDLLRADILPQPARLANPYLDLNAVEWKKATELRLKQPISVRFEDRPLDVVISVLADQIGGPQFWIDKSALLDEGISTDQYVSFAADKWPGDLVLDEILQPLMLDREIRDGVVIVTTRTKAEESLETRLYSAAGIVDETAQIPNINRRPIALGGKQRGARFGGGSFGGGMGGGGGFAVGGMGGGASGGRMIEVFGGADPLGGGNPINAIKGNAGVGDIAPPQIDEPELESPQPATPDIIAPHYLPQHNTWQPPIVGYDINPSIQMIRRSTPSKWEDEDGQGGQIGFHGPSFTFVVRQTQRVHAEIKEVLAKLRRLPKTTRVGSSIASRRISLDDPAAWDYSNLMYLIQQSVSGKWEFIDGEGGSISPHPLTASLVIRQLDKVHDEVEQLFAQLRRARYVAESLPWLTSLEGIDDLTTFLDRPTITDLPRGPLEAKSAEPNSDDELRHLAVRKVPSSMNQRWRSVSTATGQRRDVTIHRQGARLEVVLPDRTMRADGPRAAVAYPGLTLVEIDAWGTAARQVADSSLPWLTHRSNEDLAQLFDVTAESKDASSTTLRLTFPGHADTYLKVTFSNQTGAPVKWQSVLANEPQYELLFTPQTVVAVDPKGKELERWQLIADDVVTAIPALEDGWGDFIVVETSQPDTPLAQARNALRRGDNDAATQAFAKLLVDRPRQPLLNLLYAWSIGALNEPNAAQARLQREALGRLAVAGPSDLLRLITPGNFPSLGNGPMREILLTVPEERRTDDLWGQLAELAIGLNRYDLALVDIERAIAATTDEGMRTRRQLSRVELLIKNTKLENAEAAAKELAARGVSALQLVELGDMFCRAEHSEIGGFFFAQYLRTPNLTRVERTEIAFHQAAWLKRGESRWRLLIAADADRPGEQNEFLGIILSEADRAEDAVILGTLASELPPGFVQTQLLSRQADLTIDKHQAAEIALKLYKERRIPELRMAWVVEMLDRAERSKDIVEILERRLRKSGKIDRCLLTFLANSYEKLERKLDHRRATTEINERRSRPAADVVGPQGIGKQGGSGGGFFSIPAK